MSTVRCPAYDVQRTMSGTCPEMFGTLFGTFGTFGTSGTFGTFLDPGNIIRVQHRIEVNDMGWPQLTRRSGRSAVRPRESNEPCIGQYLEAICWEPHFPLIYSLYLAEEFEALGKATIERMLTVR